MFIFLFLSFFCFNVLQATPPIIQSGAGFFVIAPAQITQPGTYTLSQDIVGTVTIAANQVIFNLNNHQITPPSAGDAIDITNQTDITIQNGFLNGGNNGISINSCQRINIEDLTITNQLFNGVLLVTGASININNCNFQGPSSGIIGGTVGILISNGSYCTINNSTLNNYITAGVSAIFCGNNAYYGNNLPSYGCTLNNLTIANNYTGIFLASGLYNNFSIYNCTFNNTGASSASALALQGGGSGGSLIIGNTFVNNAGYALAIGSTLNTINNNTFQSNSTGMLVVPTASGNNIMTNNTFQSNNTGLSFAISPFNGSGNIVNNNTFQSNTTSIVYGTGTNSFANNILD